MTAIAKPSLAWIDVDKLVTFAETRFGKSAKKVEEASVDDLRVEPTLALVRAGLTGESVVNSDTVDLAVSITKTIQNAVGLFHQDVLGAVENWSSTGTSGGVIDLKGVSPVTGETIVAELKMRFNTIKASDEKNTWDGLKNAARVSGTGVKAYIFQIVPKTTVPYDRPWAVSGRAPIEEVRCADGVTAYHLVTGSPTALFDLMRAMPYVISEMANRSLGNGASAQLAFKGSEQTIQDMLVQSLPLHSHYDAPTAPPAP